MSHLAEAQKVVMIVKNKNRQKKVGIEINPKEDFKGLLYKS
jgi:hypothetical protein